MQINRTRFLSILAAIFVGLSSWAFADDVYQPWAEIPIPEGITQKQALSVAQAALVGREWMVKEKTDDKVVGYLNHRNNEAGVLFETSENTLKLSAWGYELNKNGVRKKAELNEKWLKFLRRDVNEKFSTLILSKK